jgi:hypothetical protein
MFRSPPRASSHFAPQRPLAWSCAGVFALALAACAATTSGGDGSSAPRPSGTGGSTNSGNNGGDSPNTGGTPASSSGGSPSTATGGSGTSSGGNSGNGGATSDGPVAMPSGGSGGENPPVTPGGAVVNWVQAAGPDGTWRVDVPDAPTHWSVAANQNILWKAPLPSEGQGGIAIWGDTLYLATFPEFAGAKNSSTIMGHAIDKANGKIKWSVKLQGNGKQSPMCYSYSDSTSWTPIVDGKSVCFFDSAGEMGCWDLEGKEIWRRSFPGQPEHFPFNRQHEPIFYNDTLITLSPLGEGDPAGKAGQTEWNYLHGIDKATGKTKWIAEAASTFYNTAVMGKLADGTPAVLHGRGGPHGVAERPVGLSMTSLAPGNEGKTLWTYEGSGTALYTMTWDTKYAYWFTTVPNESHVVLDASTGKVVRTQSLFQKADVRFWEGGKYVLHADVNIRDLTDPTYGGNKMHVMPNWHTNIAAGGYHWFLTSTNNNRSGSAGGHSGPPHCVGRVNVESGKVEYLELPVGVERGVGMPERFIFGKSLKTTAADIKGNDLASDDRSHTDGWEIPAFFPSPIALGNKIYFGTTLGITYVFDANAAVLDEKALLGVGDLGPNGQTWSLAGPSYSAGVLYHHSSKEVVAIKAGAATP